MRFAAGRVRIVLPTLGPTIIDLFIVGVASLVVLQLSHLHATTPVDGTVQTLRRVAVVLSLGAARSLREPAGELAEACPVSRAYRLFARLAILGVIDGALWAMAVLRVDALVPGVAGIVPALSLEWAALLMSVAVTAEMLRRRLRSDVAAALAPGLVLAAVMLGAALLPPSLPLFVDLPDDPSWGASHRVWAGLFGLAAIGFARVSVDLLALDRLLRAPLGRIRDRVHRRIHAPTPG